MKVKELKEILSEMNDEDDVIVDVWDEDIYSPRADVINVREGFDWYSRCVILTTTPRLAFLQEK